MKADLLEVAERYLREARAYADALATQLGAANILNAVNSSGMPREGVIEDFGGSSYFIHGAGCRIEAVDGEIDFDFGPNGRITGFDPWKLYNFARARPELYPWLPDRTRFEREIGKLIDDGVLRRSSADPNRQLLSIEHPQPG